MLTVCTFKWGSRYGAGHVNILREIVARHLTMDHEFVCVTDDPAGLDSRIRIVPLWPDLSEYARCYRRLRAFGSDMRGILGERFVWLDLDCVVVDSLDPLFERPEPLVLCGVSAGRNAYNGSMLMMDAGSHPEVWTRFDPVAARSLPYIGSDQAWMQHVLGADVPRWTRRDGVHRWEGSMRLGPHKGARIVIFPGPGDPSTNWCRIASPWIEDHWHDR